MVRISTVPAVLIAVAAALPALPFVGEFWLTLASYIGIASLVALGLVLLTGVGSMTSFGQVAFVGAGAYTTAVLTKYYDVSPWLSLPASLMIAAVLAVMLGAITVRLSGHFLSLSTLAWGLTLYYLFGSLSFLGGHDGFNALPPLRIGEMELLSSRAYFGVILAAVVIAHVLTFNLLSSRFGRAVRALRDGSAASEAFGINTARVRLAVFVYAAVLAAMAGWLYAHYQRVVAPSSFGATASIEYLIMAVLGGAGHLYGALIGAGIVTLLKNEIQNWAPVLLGRSGNFETIVFGVLLVLMLQLASDGLWPRISAMFPKRKIIWPEFRGVLTAREALPQDADVPLLEVMNLAKSFGGLKAVTNLSFGVRSGEIVGLIGPNGAGKSTTFDLITGLQAPTAGQVLVRGEDVTGMNARDLVVRGLARNFQHVKLIPDMTVLENVAIGAHARSSAGMLSGMFGASGAEESAIFNEAHRHLARVGMSDMMNLDAGKLSLGQARIVEIARALAASPKLLLLDEPAAGLRHHEKEQLAALLRALRDEGIAILIVEHDMEFVMNLTGRLVVLDFGTKIAEGTPQQVRENQAVIEAYLGVEE